MNLPLFQGITVEKDIKWLGGCIDGEVKSYESGDTIIAKGDSEYFIRYIVEGIVFSPEEGEIKDVGAFLCEKEDWIESEKSFIAQKTYLAKTNCKVLQMRNIRANKLCSYNCAFHKQFLEQLDLLMK